MIRVKGKARIISAGILADRFRELTEPVKVREDYFLVENGIPGFGYVDFRLLVDGSGEINLIYDSLKGGYLEKKVSLK